MTREDIISYLEPFWSRTLSFMKEALRSDVPLLDSVNESVAGASGKMLRPMMSLLVARAIGTPNDDSCRYASACELLHNATLMHDDVADESSRRRGRPTVSALLGPSAAVLVGDFWLSKAVELAAKSQHFVKVVKIFSKSLTDLAEGEMFQMEKAGSCDTDEEDYYRIIKCKTASLFEAAGVSGACSVDAGEAEVEAARNFSVLYGMAFQIKDDILDYEYCRQLRELTLSSGGIEYALARLDEFVGRAIEALGAFADTRARECLEYIARQNAHRRI